MTVDDLYNRLSTIKPGVVLPHANLIDEAPTIAHVLGLDMGDVEGRILHEILL